MDLIFEETDDEDDPQPRASVILRIQQEESIQGLVLHDPNRVRRGSCTGTTITDLIMCGIDDNRFVLPYFHHIKHHEVRALKEWLAQRRHVERSGSIGRMEKVLHCLQLLQTGCRYESLAVIFSRSPLQVKASCQEVVQGLLSLYADTIDSNAVTKQVVQEYMPLWGLWDKYKLSVKEAVLYYGFHATEIAKVIGALNLYIGRWRMQGGFAVSGPVFSWGHVFVLASSSKPAYNVYREDDERNSEDTVEDEDDDSTSTIRPAAMLASGRFEMD
ncbi:hypothetical protein IQ07DRAFT_590052 [Pyrenochaeta sp. DS3sAY3a]|nr:hypothetical protein IQ07DRAFT_590052 [Pyrenochaeta sp. DS3sAY3a]